MRTALAAIVAWPAAQLAKQQAAQFERQQLAWRKLLRLPQLVSSAIDTPVGTTPYDVVLEIGTLAGRRATIRPMGARTMSASESPALHYLHGPAVTRCSDGHNTAEL